MGVLSTVSDMNIQQHVYETVLLTICDNIVKSDDSRFTLECAVPLMTVLQKANSLSFRS